MGDNIMAEILDYNSIDLNNIVYDSPSKQKGGFYTSFIKYQNNDDKIPIIVQTPKLRLAGNPTINDSRSYLDIILDKDTPGFYEFISNLDDYNIQTAFKKSEEWFSNQFEIAVIDDFYTSQIRLSKKTRKPVIRFKIPISKGNILTNVFNEKKESIKINSLKENTEVILLIELTGMRFLKQQFLCDWTIHQIKKCESKNTKLIDECLIDEMEEEQQEEFSGPYDDEIGEEINEEKLDLLVKESIIK